MFEFKRVSTLCRADALPLLCGVSKYSRVTDPPVALLLVERLKSPPVPRPVGAHGRIAVVDLGEKIRNRFPAQVQGDLCSDVQVNSGNKQIAAGSDQSGNVAQALVCFGWSHVAEKVARNHDVVASEAFHKFRVPRVSKLPTDPFL